MKNTCLIFYFFMFLVINPLESYSNRSLEADEYWGIYYETSEGAYLLFGNLNDNVKSLDTSDKEYIRFTATLSSLEDCVNYVNSNNHLIFYYRQEGDKIYRYDESSGKDLLLYDFGLSVGETIDDGDGNRLMVEDVFEARSLSDFSMFVNGEKAIRLRGVDNPSLTDIWIENVGSIKTGILLASDLEGMKTASLSYFTASRGSYSIAFPLNTPWLKSVPFFKHDPDDDMDSEDYPDDSGSDHYYVDNDIEDYMIFEFIDDTLAVKGRLNGRMCPADFDVMGGIVNNGTIYMFFQNIHFLFEEFESIGTSDFEVKIPGFEAGTYTIKTLSLFMEIPDTTIVCHGAATGIHGITAPLSKPTGNVIYDLSGRRLNQAPERGLYIQNGKKVINY